MKRWMTERELGKKNGRGEKLPVRALVLLLERVKNVVSVQMCESIDSVLWMRMNVQKRRDLLVNATL